MGQPGWPTARGVTMVLAKQNIPILNGEFVLPKIQNVHIQKTLADLSPEPPQPPSSSSVPPTRDELVDSNVCTICGQKYSEKTAFNAHIRAHLKEKLNTRLGRTQKAKSPSPTQVQPAKRKLEVTSEMQPSRTKIKVEVPVQVKEEVDTSIYQPIVKQELDPLALMPNNSPSPALIGVRETVDSLSNCPFSREMELNRVELNNDLSSILDQIEKDFEGPNLNQVVLDTPPESDSETDLLRFLTEENSVTEAVEDQKDFDLPSPLVEPLPPTPHQTTPDHDYLVGRQTPPPSPVQPSLSGPLSLHKFASLPAKAIAVLNQLPGKLVLQKSGNDSRVINVFKVEKLGGSDTSSSTLINIECLQDSSKDSATNMTNAKIIETTRGTEGEKEYKIVLGVDRSEGGRARLCPSKSRQSADCSICGKSITTKNMARHMEKHTGKKKFQCEICQSSFFQKTHLKNHIVLHENGEYHKCEECGQKFLRKTDLQKHQKTVHCIDVTLSCNVCGEQFQDAVKLELHKSSHFYERKELCGLCGDKFEDKEAMMAHMQLHTSAIIDKPYSCTVCHKTFAQKGHLNRHMKSHGGELDLVCLVCNQQCKDKLELARHRADHLSCPDCNSLFESEVSLQQHRLRDHLDSSPLHFLSPGPLLSPPSTDSDMFEDSSNCSTSYSTTSPTLDMFSSPTISPSYSEAESPSDSFSSFLTDFDSTNPMLHDPLGGMDKTFSRLVDVAEESYMQHLTLDDISDSSFFDISHQLDDELYSTDLFSSS